MIIGSHNTMTYAAPRKWWMVLISPFTVCQTKDVDEQILEGVRCFDLRIRLKKDKWVFAHGLYEVKGDVYAIIDKIRDYANDIKENVYLRIILERSTTNEEEAKRFIEFCRCCETQLGKYVIPFEGRKKGGWELLYNFKFVPQAIWQPVSSMAEDAHWYERYIPVLYAKRKNKENLDLTKMQFISLFDFI